MINTYNRKKKNTKITRVGILEMYAENHGLLDLCKISNIDNVKVTVFTNELIYSFADQVLGEEKSDFEWVIKGKTERSFRFIKRVEKICNLRIDIINIRSLDKDLAFWNFWPKCKIMVYVAGGFFFFMPLQVIKNMIITISNSPSLYSILKSIEYFFKALRAWIFVRQSSILYTIDSAHRKWIEDHKRNKKEVYILPHTSFDSSKLKSSSMITFVVPGMIQSKRDYFLLLRIFEKIFVKYENKITLHLLGIPVGGYGDKVISICDNLKSKGYNIVYYAEYIPPKQFDDIFYGADVAVSPYTKICGGGPKRETYSYSGPSGVIADTSKYGKPAIVPDWYNVPNEFKTSYLKYKNEEDFGRLLDEIISDKNKLEKLKENAINNSNKNFSLNILKAKFRNIVNEILDK